VPAPAAPAPGRRLVLAWTLGGVVLDAARPASGERTRRRRTVCSAARVLTALGVRVEVRAPSRAWPRDGRGPGRLVVVRGPGRPPSWVADLAVRTAVTGLPVTTGAPRHPDAPRAVQRLLRERPCTPPEVERLLAAGTSVCVAGPPDDALRAAAERAGAVVCPVVVQHRADLDGRPVVSVALLPPYPAAD
jgi:hypothetical protein